LLLLAGVQQTGLLEVLVSAIMQLADPTLPGLKSSNPVVVARLLLTLLFLPVAGLARTWDLRSYTGTMLAMVTGRERAYSQRYTERFLARLAHAGAAERFTEVMAKWTWSLWQQEQAGADQPLILPSFMWTAIGRRSTVMCCFPEGQSANWVEKSWNAVNWWCYMMLMDIRCWLQRTGAIST